MSEIGPDDLPTLNIDHDMNVSRDVLFFDGSTIITSDARIEGLLGHASDRIQARCVRAQDGHRSPRDHVLDWRARWWAAMQLERN